MQPYWNVNDQAALPKSEREEVQIELSFVSYLFDCYSSTMF